MRVGDLAELVESECVLFQVDFDKEEEVLRGEKGDIVLILDMDHTMGVDNSRFWLIVLHPRHGKRSINVRHLKEVRNEKDGRARRPA